MPELAEVAWYARQWDPGLGQRVVAVRVREASRVYRAGGSGELARSIAGRAYEGVALHGKQMLFRFSGGGWLGVHLGMTGELQSAEPGADGGGHGHLVLVMERVALIFRDPRMFGRVIWEEGGDEPGWWRELPPGVLTRDFRVALVAEVLRRRAGTPLKALLLEQQYFPGIGNWMADEILWRLRLAPAVSAGKVDPAALHREVKAVARGAMRTIGRDWSDPPAGWLFRHRWKDGGRCPRCGGDLVRETLRGRTACHCPLCQAG
jgi:formamidopyrimidine-DNA glycosylase